MVGSVASRDRSPLLRYGSGRADNDEDELPVRSRHFAVANDRGTLGRLPLRTVFYAMNGVALFVLLSLCISMHNTISRLESQAVDSVETGSEAHQEITEAREDLNAGAMHYISKTGLLPMALLPSKFAVDYVTPRQDQAYRGTCWDFATIGFLEQSYRAHGVHKGWLKPDEYVAFSEQAYGVEILKLCTGDADSQQQKDCRVAGDDMWMNSTDGGEVPELYYLQNGLKESILPQSVCKYYTDIGNDTLCPGLEAALAAGNPLKFELSGMTTKYEDMSTFFLSAREGFTGGLIVKNSWADGPTQGSHSLAYWMQEVSDWEERSVCPNSYNPFNWYQCGNEGISSKQQGNETLEYNKGVENCLSDETKMFADVNIQPLHLKCKDPELCRTDGDFTYFVRNTTDWGDRMTVMCLWEYSEEQHVARERCLPPMLEVYIALTLAPVEEEVNENDTDRCGFYFIPYVALRQWIAQFQGFFVNSFDIQWDLQSYAANKDLHPELDYSLLEASTKKQNHSEFLGPFPYAKVVQHFHACDRRMHSEQIDADVGRVRHHHSFLFVYIVRPTNRGGGSRLGLSNRNRSCTAQVRGGRTTRQMNVVFVCTSNTCRSPVAEHFAVEYFRRKLNMSREQQEEKGVVIRSAALTDVFDREGSPASKHAVDVMKKYQLDLSKHRSQLLTEQMCMEADYVVCVASGMTYKVTEKFPKIKERDGVLCAFTRDLPDPWHMSYDTYMENIAQNEEMTRDFLDKHVTW
ncbi:hypothetical protein JG688_00000951 [Phytophthora aleatoria]|uniref:Phosphotyrosine protein phosphatase I domain-containing protein n=1 Tax=Phytophthora aleatoria TaxID=2496075 RepID=A0A8J5J4J9_9STRA|nr:hypothetical protein JG688_00000951 [Phytophthora aleatoria]